MDLLHLTFNAARCINWLHYTPPHTHTLTKPRSNDGKIFVTQVTQACNAFSAKKKETLKEHWSPRATPNEPLQLFHLFSFVFSHCYVVVLFFFHYVVTFSDSREVRS